MDITQNVAYVTRTSLKRCTCNTDITRNIAHITRITRLLMALIFAYSDSVLNIIFAEILDN